MSGTVSYVYVRAHHDPPQPPPPPPPRSVRAAYVQPLRDMTHKNTDDAHDGAVVFKGRRAEESGAGLGHAVEVPRVIDSEEVDAHHREEVEDNGLNGK